MNGGKCISPNTCACPTGYEPPQCEGMYDLYHGLCHDPTESRGKCDKYLIYIYRDVLFENITDQLQSTVVTASPVWITRMVWMLLSSPVQLDLTVRMYTCSRWGEKPCSILLRYYRNSTDVQFMSDKLDDGALRHQNGGRYRSENQSSNRSIAML